jgi:hypothetical protein
MLPSSAIHVVQDSADQIRVICPPNYFLGMIWILAAVILLAVLKVAAPREWKVPLIVAGLCLLPALVVLSSYEVAVLSRTDGTLKMDQRLVFYHTRQMLPLHSVQQAVVGTNEGNTHMLFFVTSSGQDVSMDIGYMPRDGYYSSALAVNTFLAGGTTANGVHAGVPHMPEAPDWAKKSDAKFAEQLREYKERLAQEKHKP